MNPPTGQESDRACYVCSLWEEDDSYYLNECVRISTTKYWEGATGTFGKEYNVLWKHRLSKKKGKRGCCNRSWKAGRQTET